MIIILRLISAPSRIQINVKIQSEHTSIHGEARCACDQCEYKANCKGFLEKHIESIHGNNKYFCKQCEYKVKQKENLERHIKSIHDNVTYPCNQCKDMIWERI